MTYTVPRNSLSKDKSQSIATSGIYDWEVLEDGKQQSQSNLYRVLKKTRKCLTEHNNFTTAYFFHDDIQSNIAFLDSKSSLFVHSELNSEVEYLLQIVRSDEISQIREIESRFHLHNRIEIINYLIENYSLISTLLDAYNQVKKVFTSKERLSLELCLDPEESSWEKLLLSIDVGCDADVDQVYLLKEILDDNWWIDVYSSVPNLDINISFDEF